MPSVYDPWVRDLLNPKVKGSDVVEKMRKHYTAVAVENKNKKGKEGGEEEEGEEKATNSKAKLNECTLRTKVSDVKRRALSVKQEDLEKGQRNTHKEYETGIRRLTKAGKKAKGECGEAVREFLAMELHEQAKEVQRREAARHEGDARSSLCMRFGKNKEVDRAFSALKVVPDSFLSMRVERKETDACRRASQTRLLRKPAFPINDAWKLLSHCRSVLAFPRDHPPYAVIASLLLATGRRTAELLNGRSHFEEWPAHTNACLFCGQLKASARVRDGMRYAIPLLAPHSDVEEAIEVVQEWQGGKEEAEKLTNKQVSVRYQPAMHRFLSGDPRLGAEPGGFGGEKALRPHTLRAVYTRYSLLLFDWGSLTDRRVAKYLLGHASAGHVQHYDHVKLRKAGKLEGEQGAFPIREEEMRRVEEVVGGGR